MVQEELSKQYSCLGGINLCDNQASATLTATVTAKNCGNPYILVPSNLCRAQLSAGVPNIWL